MGVIVVAPTLSPALGGRTADAAVADAGADIAPAGLVAAPTLVGKPVDCDNPAADETVVDSSADLEKALELIGGTIAVQPGEYPIQATTRLSARLTSCDFDKRAVITDTGVSGPNSVINFQSQGETLHVHDIDVVLIGSGTLGVNASLTSRLFVANVNFSADEVGAEFRYGSAVRFVSGGSGEVVDSNFDFVGTAIEGAQPGDIRIDNVVIRNAGYSGIDLRGASFQGDQAEPIVTISNTTVIGSGRTSGDPLDVIAFDEHPGIRAFDIEVAITDSQVGCGTGSNIALIDPEQIAFLRASPVVTTDWLRTNALRSSAAPGVGALPAERNADGSYVMTMDNVNVGFIEGPLAPAKCVNAGYGVLVDGAVDADISNSTIRGHESGTGVIVTKRARAGTQLDDVRIQNNSVGLSREAPSALVDAEVTGNGTDCVGDGELNIGGTFTDSDNTCDGGNGPLEAGAPVDCLKPQPGETVVSSSAQLADALTKVGGVIAAQPGDYEVTVAISQDTRLTSCDFDAPAVISPVGSNQLTLIASTKGTTLHVHDADFLLTGKNVKALLATSGAELIVDGVNVDHADGPANESGGVGIEYSNGAFGQVFDSTIKNVVIGIFGSSPGDLTIDNVLIENTVQSGIRIEGARPTDTDRPFNPQIRISEAVVIGAGRGDDRFGGIDLAAADVRLVDSQVGCGNSPNVRLQAHPPLLGLQAVPQGDPFDMRLDNVNVGFIDGGVAPGDCVNTDDGIVIEGNVDVSIDESSVKNHAAGRGVVVAKATPRAVVRGTIVTGNQIGLAHDGDVQLSDAEIISNGQDCLGDGLIEAFGNTRDSDGSCVDDVDDVEATITAVKDLGETSAGQRLRAEENETLVFQIDLDEPVAEALTVEWSMVGLADVVPGFRPLETSEIPEASGAVTIEASKSTATFEVKMGSIVSNGNGGFIDTTGNGGFEVSVGDGEDQSITGVLVQEPQIFVGTDGQIDLGEPYQVVDEGNPIVWDVFVSPSTPFIDDDYRVRWSFDIEEDAGVDTIDADDVESTGDEIDFTFDAERDDTKFTTRTLSIGTVVNADDAAEESFLSNVYVFDRKDPENDVSRAFGLGQINDAGDPDPTPSLTLTAVDGLTDTTIADEPVLRADPGVPTQFRIDADEPIGAQPVTVAWTVTGALQVVPDFVALPTADLTDTAGEVTLQPGDTSATFTVMVAANDPGETAGFEVSIGDDPGQTIEGLVVGRPTVSVIPTDLFVGDVVPDLLIVEGDPIDVRVSVSPANPFVDGNRSLTWRLDPGAVDGIDADDVEAVAGVIDIDYDPDEDFADSSIRTVSVATLLNEGDFGGESFTFTAELRDSDSDPDVVASGSIDGLIADSLPVTITPVDSLTDSSVGPLLRADVGDRVQFRVEIAEPKTGQPLQVPWQIFGADDVVPGFRGIEADEITEQFGTATIAPGETSTTFEVLLADVDPNETVGFRIRIGNGDDQSFTGLLVGTPLLIATNLTEAIDEGDPIEVDVRLSPANPFFDEADVVTWTLAPGAVDGIDADDVEALTGTAAFVYDPAVDDPNFIDRVVSIPTLSNDGDAPLESFEFDIAVSNTDLGPDPLNSVSIDGEIRDGAADGDPVVTIRPADEWQLTLLDGTDAVVLLDGDEASEILVEIDAPRATRTSFEWTIVGAEIDGERAASTTGDGNDFDVITGEVSIAPGQTSTNVFLRSEPDDGDEPHEGFTFSITEGAAEVVSLPGLIEADSFVIDLAPVDGVDDDLVIGVADEGTVDAAITVTPAPLLPTSFVQEWKVLGNGTFGDGAATAADFAATSGSISLGLDSSGGSLASVTRELTIEVVDDDLVEAPEGFELVLPATDGTEAQVLLGVIYDGTEPTAEDGTSFGGLKVADVKGDVESDENGPTGTARGKIKLPSFDLELPVDIVFADGAVTVTYEDTFDDISLSSGEGAAAREYLRIEDPAVKVQARATARGKVTAFVQLTADTGLLFPDEIPGTPVGARVDDLSVTVNSEAVIVMTARQVTGTFGTVTVTGPQPRLIISDDPSVPLLTVGDITTSGGFTLTGLTIARDGTFEFDEACLDPNDWLNGGLDVIGLPVEISTSCVFSTADGTRAQITGSFDEDALSLLGATATVTIGDGETNSFDTLFDLDSYSFTPRDLGPINIALEEFETNGYTVSGSFEVAGYTAGVLDPSFDGEFTVVTPGDGTITSSVDGNITTTGDGLSSTTAIDIFLETAAENIGLDSDLLTVPSASLGLNFGYETTETTTLTGAVPDPDGKRLLDLFRPDAPSDDFSRPDAQSDDFMNSYILAVLNYYVYLDSYGLPNTPTDATFAETALRPAIESLGGELVDFFSDDNGVQGAIIRTDEVLLVIGRGSDTTADYALQAVGALPNDAGEHGAVAEAADVMQVALDAALADRGDRKLWISGHSYGGSLASIVVGRLPDNVVVDGFVTFGAPAPFTSDRNALEALDPTSPLMQGVRWNNQSDPIPLFYLPGVYAHQNDPTRIVVDADGACSIDSTYLELGAGIDADDHGIGRYAHRIFNLAPADVRAAVLSTQQADMTITVVPVGDVISGGGADCDEEQPFTKQTETTITGPVLTSADAEVALRIPGLTDDAGQAIEIGASVSLDNGVWTAEAVLDPDIAYRFGGFRLNDLTGVLEVDTNTGAVTPVDGSFTASIEIPAAEGDPIPIDVALDFETNAAGVLTANVAGSLEFTGELFGGTLSVDTATLDVTGSATFDAADISNSTLAVTAVLDLKGAELELGAFEVELGDVEFNYDGDPATPLFSAATIEGRIADPNDPAETLLGVTITGLVLNDDGTVNVDQINVRDLDDLQERFALAGVLPYVVSEITLTTTNGDFNAFTLNVEGDVDLTVFPDDVDTRFSYDDDQLPTCSDPAGPDEFELDFAIEVTSARDFEFAPTEMSNIFLGVCDLDVGPFEVDASIAFGGYEDGDYSGDVTAEFGLAADGDLGSIDASATVVGDLQFLADGAARLDLDGSFAVSGSFDDIVTITDASIDLGFAMSYDPNGVPVFEIGDFSVESADVGSVEVDLGDFVTLESSGADLFPEPGVIVSVVGGEDDDDAFFSAVLGDDAGPLDGWGGTARNFKIVTDPVTGIDIELHPGFGIEIEAGDDASTGLPSWVPFVIREAGISWPELAIGSDGLDVDEPVRLGDLVANIGDAEILFSGGLSSEQGPLPFDAQVDGLRIDIGALTRFVTGNPRDGDRVIVGLNGIKLGMEPTEFGPLTVGGVVTVGQTEGDDPIFYLSIEGTFGFDGVEVAGQLVVSEYGPVALEFASPLAVPLGPSGLVLSGVSGGVDFLSEFGSIEIVCEEVTVGDDGDAGQLCEPPTGDAGPLALLDNEQFPIESFTFDPADLAADIAARQADGGSPLIPQNFTVRIGGKLTHVGAAGVVNGDVTLAANLSTSDDTSLKFLGAGTITAAGVQSGADARFLIDLTKPIEPVITIAAQIPTEGDWLAAVLPVEAQVGITIDTNGLAPGMVLALRQFIIDSAQSAAITEVALPRLAAVLEVDHDLELSKLLLDIDGNGQVSPTEDAAVITAAFIVDRLVGADDPLLVDWETAGGVGAVLARDMELALRVANAVIADLFAVLDPDFIEEFAASGNAAAFEPITVAEARALFDDFLATARRALVGDGTPGDTGALGVLLETADPKLLIDGNIQVEAFGLPIGSEKALTVYVDKEQLIFEATGSIWEQLRAGCGIPGCSQVLYLSFLGLNDQTSAAVSVPFKLENLLTGGDIIDGGWAVGLSSELSAFGLPLGTATGFIVPAGNQAFVDQQIDGGGFVIPVSDAQRQVIAENGGIMFEGNLSLPNFVTNPVSVITDLSEECTTAPDRLAEIPGWITDCFDIATDGAPVGAVQGYLPAPDFSAFDDLSAGSDTKLADVIAEIDDQLSVAYLQGTLGNPDVNGDGKVDDKEKAAEPFRILGLPLGQAEVSASTDGLSVRGEVPIIGSPVTFDVIIPNDPAKPKENYPRVGGTLELDSDGIARAINSLGFGDIVDLKGIKAEGSFRAYSPGFDTTAAATPLQRTGGIEMELTANIAIPGVINVDGAKVFIQITPSATGVLNITASVSVDSVKVGGFTVTDAAVEFSVADGKASGSVSGSVKLPGSLTDGNGAGTVAVAGSFSTGQFALAVEANSVKVGPLSMSGALSITGGEGGATLEIKPVGTASTARVSIDGLVTVQTSGVSISSTGAFSVNVIIPEIGVDAMKLTGLDATFSGRPSGDSYSLRLVVAPGAQLKVKPLSTTRETVIDFPAFVRTIGTDDLEFSRTFTIPAIELGSFMQTSSIRATVAFEDGELSLQQNREANITVLQGATAKINGLRIDTAGNVEGEITGALTVFDNTIANVEVDLQQVPDGTTGRTVLELRLAEARMDLRYVELDLTGFIRSDGKFSFTASSSLEIESPGVEPGFLDTITFGALQPRVVASYDGTVTLTNVGPIPGSLDAEVCLFGVCAAADGVVDRRGVISGSVSLTGLGRLPFRFPDNATPRDGSNPPVPRFTGDLKDVAGMATTTMDLAVFPQAVPTATIMYYDLPEAENASSVTCFPASGTEFAVGTTAVQCEARGEFQSAYTQFRVNVLTVSDFATFLTPSTDVTDLSGATLSNTLDGSLIVQSGQTFKGEAGPFTPNSKVDKRAFSDPIDLGTEVANANGIVEWTVTIPDELPVGRHTLVIRGEVGDGIPIFYNVALEVREDTLEPGGELPATGVSSPVSMLWVALGLIVLGMLLVGARRRRGLRVRVKVS